MMKMKWREIHVVDQRSREASSFYSLEHYADGPTHARGQEGAWIMDMDMASPAFEREPLRPSLNEYVQGSAAK